MQLHAVDGRARDPGGSPFACESGCACPRERHAVGAGPTGKSSERSAGAWSITRPTAPGRLLPGASHAIGKHRCGRRSAPASPGSSCQSATPARSVAAARWATTRRSGDWRLAGAGSRGVDRDAHSCSRGPGRPAGVRGCLCLVPAAGRRSRHVDLVPASLAGRDVRFCASGCC
jgi:hypothetical protein